ncbi:MAG: SurA N-terminal domain-containing protein [Clostridia bacterium]|nr:SurA N-terminal domain-containing protein [Clostridia bacterium]
MKKKTLFILLLAAVLTFSGCSSLVLRDSDVDARQTILTVNGEHITKQRFVNLYNYNLYTEQQYAQLLAQFGMSDGTVDTANVLQNTAQSFISSNVIQHKAAELGLDQFTDEEKAAMDADAETQYAEQLESVKSVYFADSDPSDEELEAAARNEGITLETVRASVEQNMVEDRLKEYASRDVTVDDAALQSALDEKISAQKERFENSANAYNTARNGSDTIFYTPAGYRIIQVIELTGDDAEAEVKALIDRAAQGEAMHSLGAEVREYAVREGSTLPSADVANAAMALNEAGSVTEAIQTSGGYAFAKYVQDVEEATVTLEAVRDELYDETLETARTDAYNAAMTEWVNAADVQLYLDRLN